ncbi:hypothetical protein IFR05_011855 [Cadophora sp. M221]|nr:hypothetical protein IFR05_011855 [Cadophora sp. M221]
MVVLIIDFIGRLVTVDPSIKEPTSDSNPSAEDPEDSAVDEELIRLLASTTASYQTTLHRTDSKTGREQHARNFYYNMLLDIGVM